MIGQVFSKQIRYSMRPEKYISPPSKSHLVIFRFKIAFLDKLGFFFPQSPLKKKYFLFPFRIKITARQIVFQTFNFLWNRWKVITRWWDFLNGIFIPSLRGAGREREKRWMAVTSENMQLLYIKRVWSYKPSVLLLWDPLIMFDTTKVYCFYSWKQRKIRILNNRPIINLSSMSDEGVCSSGELQ